MARVFVAIGSNINPLENVPKAIRLLSRKIRLRAISTFYCTEPLGSPHGDSFVNGIVEFETETPPNELKFGLLRKIERELHRKRTMDKNAPRTIDLDLIIYGDKSIHTDKLDIPDPEILERPFLAIPLGELAPDLVLPGLNQTVKEAADKLAFHPRKRLDELSVSLRKEFI